MENIEMQIVALSSSESSPGNFVIVLESIGEKRKLGIIIGQPEAQSIAVRLERMALPRPLTHDTFLSTIQTLGATLKAISIHSFTDGIFYAKLILKNNTGEEVQVDCRPSDALALAVRFECPIYSNQTVLSEASLYEKDDRQTLLKSSLAEYSLDELQSLLNSLLAKEDYESASRIRDMIRKRME